MRIAKVVGTVTLSQSHPSFRGATLKLAAPMSLKELRADGETSAEEIVVFDEFGAGIGDHIFLTDGGEAAQPFLPELKPVDAYNSGILDKLQDKTI